MFRIYHLSKNGTKPLLQRNAFRQTWQGALEMGRKGEPTRLPKLVLKVEALSGRRSGSKTSKLEPKLEIMETKVIPQIAEEMLQVKAQRDNLGGEGTLATFLSAVRHLFAGRLGRRYEKPDGRL
jgi:hypothetical protein